MTDITIRRADQADAATIVRLINEFFAEERFPVEPGDVALRADAFFDEPGNAAFLAFDAGRAIGVATVTSTVGFETGRYAELEDLWVEHAARGTGIARRLIEAAAEWCRDRGCSELEVIVTRDAAQAHGLVTWYEQIGFRDMHRTVLWLGL